MSGARPSPKPSPLVHALAWLAMLFVASTASAGHANCEMSLSTTQVDYGRLSRAMLAAGAGGTLALPSRTLALHVRCPAPQDMTLSFHGMAASVGEFRFTDHGRFSLRLRDALLDGERVELGEVGSDDAPLNRIAASLAWRPGTKMVPVRNGLALSGREFTAWMDIEAAVDEQALMVNDASSWAEGVSVEAAATGTAGDMVLRAEVIPGRCSVDVIRHLSFGRLRSADLDSHGGSTRIASIQSAQLQILCDAPTPVALRVMRDERAGTVAVPVGVGTAYADAQLFGLGKTPSGEHIGSYVLRWSAKATSDRGELQATRSVNGAGSWTPAGGPALAEHTGGERLGYAAIEDTTAGPLAVKTLNVGLDATIYIAPRRLLSLNEEIRADGLVTFEIIY